MDFKKSNATGLVVGGNKSSNGSGSILGKSESLKSLFMALISVDVGVPITCKIAII